MSIPSVSTPTVTHAPSDASNLAEKISIRSLNFFYGAAKALKDITAHVSQRTAW